MTHCLPPTYNIVHTFLPLKKGLPLNNGQNAHPKSVPFSLECPLSEVPLHTDNPEKRLFNDYKNLYTICDVT